MNIYVVIRFTAFDIYYDYYYIIINENDKSVVENVSLSYINRSLRPTKMYKKRTKYSYHITFFHWMLLVLHNVSCNKKRY